jgi:co-chaperonin GroES (HSP10)
MQTPAFQPGGSRYLVLPDPIGQDSETIGGITLSTPKDPHKQAIEGTVVAKGKSCINYEWGDKVMYGQFSGYDLKLDDVDYKVLQENEILGEHLVTLFDKNQPDLPLVMGELVGGETIQPPAPIQASTLGICYHCGKPAETATSTWCNDCMPF